MIEYRTHKKYVIFSGLSHLQGLAIPGIPLRKEKPK